MCHKFSKHKHHPDCTDLETCKNKDASKLRTTLLISSFLSMSLYHFTQNLQDWCKPQIYEYFLYIILACFDFFFLYSYTQITYTITMMFLNNAFYLLPPLHPNLHALLFRFIDSSIYFISSSMSLLRMMEFQNALNWLWLLSTLTVTWTDLASPSPTTILMPLRLTRWAQILGLDYWVKILMTR